MIYHICAEIKPVVIQNIFLIKKDKPTSPEEDAKLTFKSKENGINTAFMILLVELLVKYKMVQLTSQKMMYINLEIIIKYNKYTRWHKLLTPPISSK